MDREAYAEKIPNEIIYTHPKSDTYFIDLAQYITFHFDEHLDQPKSSMLYPKRVFVETCQDFVLISKKENTFPESHNMASGYYCVELWDEDQKRVYELKENELQNPNSKYTRDEIAEIRPYYEKLMLDLIAIKREENKMARYSEHGQSSLDVFM